LGYLAAAQPLESFAGWAVSGAAAIIALLLANVDKITSVVSLAAFKWGILLLTLSILAGILAKQFGIAIRSGLQNMDAMYQQFFSEEGIETLRSCKMPPAQMLEAMLTPLPWPVLVFAKAHAVLSATDFLAGEKLFLRIWCYQFYGSIAQSALGVAGLMSLALGM
jgi:hypothetical protein